MRFKAGWLVPQQIIALTHFVPLVTAEDFQQILETLIATLQSVESTNGFHALIDNRKIAETNLASLDMMLQVFPQLNHLQLKWIIVILPEAISTKAEDLENQQVGSIHLKYVNNLEDAYKYLTTIDKGINLEQIDSTFFINT